MGFEEAFQVFMNKHCNKSEGERLKRLKEHGYLEKLLLEKVWWPAIGNFDHLHPEYEVVDYKDGDRFLDYAFIQPFIRINLEGDGYNPHSKGASKWQFSDERNRQNDLIIDDWIVIRFTYDDITSNPRRCQMKLQQLMGKVMTIISSLLDKGAVEVIGDGERIRCYRLLIKDVKPFLRL